MSTGQPTRPLRIVLADDQALLREGLVGILQRAGHDVVEAVDDAAKLEVYTRRLHPDLVITDIRMPPTHRDEGLRAAARVRAEHPQIAIMVLSAYVAGAYVEDLLNTTNAAGVGYLLKDRVGHVREFLASVDQVAAGQVVIDPEVVRQLLGRRRLDGPMRSLTPRELDVLALMAQGKTNGSIAQELVVTDAAVRKHVGNIFAKLDLGEGADRRVRAVLAYLRGEVPG